MLVFLAAMVGFCLTGDLFNMVVFFELMGAVAYALTAYQIEERGPIQGAINFAITNSVGAYADLHRGSRCCTRAPERSTWPRSAPRSTAISRTRWWSWRWRCCSSGS